MSEDTLEGFRLSPQQRHIWLLQKGSAASPYLSQCAVLIEGTLDAQALEAALQDVVDRNEILRTTFHHLPGLDLPVQVINDGVKIVLSRSRLDDKEAAGINYAELLRNEAPANFEPAQNSLLRSSLFAIADNAHVMVVTLPAQCADRVTMANLLRELASCYGSQVQTSESVQYADLSEWQNELLESETAQWVAKHWSEQDIFPSLDVRIPFEHKSDGQAFSPLNISFRVGSETARRLDEQSSNLGVGCSALLLSCWQVLMYRLTGRSDLLCGILYDGRNYEELENALGPFARHLPVRCSLEDSATFRDLIVHNANAMAEADKWQECFDWGLFESPDTGLPQERFFPLCFEFDQLPREYTAAGLNFKVCQSLSYIDRFKIKVRCVREPETFRCELHFDSNLFASRDIDSLGKQFLALCEAVAGSADLQIGRASLLNEADKGRLLESFDYSLPEQDYSQCVHHLFERRAAEYPQDQALVFEDQSLTYGELNERANHLARMLQSCGVGPDVPVALYAERSPEMIEGMLAILKAGGAYVPLDPALPKERLAWMLSDIQAPVLLTQKGLLERVSDYKGIVINLDAPSLPEQNASQNCVSSVNGSNLVYIIYTSGSTGRPKGVAVEHRNLFNYVQAIGERLGLKPNLSYASVTTLAADLGNTSIFAALCLGGTLHLISTDRASDAEALADYFTRHSIDCLKIVPSHLNALISTRKASDIIPRSLLILGGEACSTELVDRIRSIAPGCAIINHYGPTETTVGVLADEIKEADYITASVPLGRPIKGARAYVLNSFMELCPVWSPGQLYIGGEGVARGYLNAPDQTAERFLPDPFCKTEGATLYRTGDLARYLPDGRIEFLGRIDGQVKIRGFRVEPGEVQAILRNHPAVSDAAVIAEANEADENRLIAYVVFQERERFSSSELKESLRDSLPDHLMPSVFVELEKLPLTANGKLDYRALPPVKPTRPGSGESQQLLTAVEGILSGIWASLLKVESVNLNDNFFESGGHSLLATQIISRIRQAFQIDLPLRTVFDAPTLKELSAKVEAARRADHIADAPPIKPVSRDRQLPLSYAQQRLWILDQLEPGSAAYNIPVSVRFKGHLNADALSRSFSAIVKRHEVLRTCFALNEGNPMQIIVDAEAMGMPVQDLRELPDEAREKEIKRIAREESQEPFDLTRAPLLRLKLVLMAEDENVVFCTLHHIVSDNWSTGVLIEELSGFYNSFCAGKSALPEELPIQYADFACWQKEWLNSGVLEQQLAYWRKQLVNISPLLELPTDRPRPPVQSYRGARYPVNIPKPLTETLISLSRAEDVTLFMTVATALKILLYRYSGQEEIVIGSPIAGRNRVEIESLIGFFVNTLVLRTDMSGDPGFRNLLEQVRKTALEAYCNQDLPFEKLVDELQPKRSLSHSPLFQVAFALQNAPKEALKLDGLEVVSKEVGEGTAKFDLTLVLSEIDGRLSGGLEYNTDLFDEATISQMVKNFQTLLESITANPSESISRLDLMTEADRAQLLAERVAARKEFPKDRCLHRLFEDQAERSPNANALALENQEMSYGELNRRANQLAHYLSSVGVGPESLVGIFMERSVEMLVSILAVLKSGAGYVPLDPVYPKQRLDFIIEDAKMQALLTLRDMLDQLPECKLNSICVDADWEKIEAQSQLNLSIELSADNAAYVIYTSGSTGKPKGVLVSHGNVARLFSATHEWFHFDESDVWTLFHSYAFDFSVWEIWGALIYGGKLVIVPYWISRSPESFYALLAEQQVTVLNQTPSAFRQLIAAEEMLGVAAPRLFLRLVIFGGEALELQSLKPWFDKHGDDWPQLVNMYGITETTVHVTYRPIKIADVESGAGSVIGKPIHDLQLYVLDKHQSLVPVGVAGELCVGGEGLARGYLERADQTAGRFIPNAFANAPGDRLYCSGDLARYLRNGDLEYIGRIDEQVKIRGFRIELGEIEQVLCQHDNVREAIVVAKSEHGNDKRLVAYIVFKDDGQNSTHELRTFLKDKLPEYMIPAAFVSLDKIPLTANGKLDRRALPAPEAPMPDQDKDFLAPGNHIEEILARAWSDVLGLPEISVDDNFFELGGDSILGIQIIAKANQAGLKLTPKDIFMHQTIAQLASITQTGALIQAEQGIVSGHLPLTPIQRWFFELDLQEPHHWNQAMLLEAGIRLDPQLVEKVFEKLLEHHDALRLRFENEPPFCKQYNAVAGGPVPFTVVNLTATPPHQRTPALELEAERLQSSLDLSRGPLLRAALFEFGKDHSQRLLIIIHHLAMDGVSWRILLEDFQTAYNQAAKGELLNLGRKTTSFKEWAQRLNDYAQSETCKQELEYWIKQTETRAALPVDFPEGINTEESAEILVQKLSEQETRALLYEVPEAYRTQINDLLLAALAQTLYQWTGSTKVVIDMEGHGRAEIIDGTDLTRTVGWFTTMHPVVLEFASDMDTSDLIKRMKENLRAVPNKGIGWGLLKYIVNDAVIKERLDGYEESEISFNYFGQTDQAASEELLLRRAAESTGQVRSLKGIRHHLLSINALVNKGQLQINLSYSKNIHSAATVKEFARLYTEALRLLIAHCQSPEAGGHTPSDFPLARLRQEELDKAFADVEFE